MFFGLSYLFGFRWRCRFWLSVLECTTRQVRGFHAPQNAEPDAGADVWVKCSLLAGMRPQREV